VRFYGFNLRFNIEIGFWGIKGVRGGRAPMGGGPKGERGICGQPGNARQHKTKGEDKYWCDLLATTTANGLNTKVLGW
jgi:hypothetical protein